MEIRESFHLPAPPDDAARTLLDVETVAGCVPGVQDVSLTDDGTWVAVLASQLGPIRVRFAGTLAIDDSAAPNRISATGQGTDRGTGSKASVSMEASLAPDDTGETDVDVVANVVIRGKLGQFGTGIIQATATEMTKEFVSCLSRRITTETGIAEPETDGDPGGPPRAAPFRPTRTTPTQILRRALGSWFRTRLRRLFGRAGP